MVGDVDVGRVILELKSIGCCPRCTLRYVNVKKPQVFRSFEDVQQEICKLLGEEEKEEEEENSSRKRKRERRNPCVTCFGILQELSDVACLVDIKSAVEESDFQFKEFVLSLSVPLCSILQEHIVMVHMKRKFPTFYKDLHIASVKEVWKWISGAFIEREFQVTFNIHSPLDIIVVVEYADDMKESKEMLNQLKWKDSNVKKNHSGPSRANIEKAIINISDEDIMKYATWPPCIPKCQSIFRRIECNHKSIYVAGRYNKYSRKLSQTPWIIDGEKLMDTSIKELICDKITSHFKANDVKFLSSGREDVDVRTLGKGRPFGLEFINPHRVFFNISDLKEFQKEINDSTSDIAVRDLQIVSRDDIYKLKAGEETKTKSYSALCFSREPICLDKLNELKNLSNLTLLQKTPIRVLHRRPLAVREKVIHQMSAEALDQHHFRLHLNTQAGTYIKEFVHGDFGRTKPSLGTLLEAETDILELDVEAVELDWPPSLE